MSDYRTHIRVEWPPDKILQALKELADAEAVRSHDVTCKGCGNTYSYKLPTVDARTRLSAIQFIADHGYGRAVQAEPDTTKPVDPNIDPTKLDPQARKALITQLQARIAATPEPPAIRPIPDVDGVGRVRAED